MGKTFIKSYTKTNIKEIKITDFPVVLFSDSHTNTRNIDRLFELYPNSPLICLGDITFLFSKPGETYNQKSIDYFIDKKIPCLQGNHDSHVLSCSLGNSLSFLDAIHTDTDIYDLTQQHINYLQSLPIGFKLLLPGGDNYLLFHNSPNDLWGFRDESFKEFAFLKEYPIHDRTVAIIRGHEHRHFVIDFPNIRTKLITIGRLSKDGDYALLTEKGVEAKKL